ncbi:M24 family metallopeptidase [Parvularcula marina]|uniref:M24 family metallopeptidase n=1 Tax=Parvularcula marina TaxID=2292771 RepID=UPI0035153EB6
MITKRDFLKTAAAGTALAGLTTAGTASATGSAIRDVGPITTDERIARIEKAQRLMGEHGLGGILLEPGPSMTYFTGLTWWRSERMTAVIIPAEGDVAVVTPAFEEPSIRERMEVAAEVRVWNEDESPYALVKGILEDRGVTGPLGLEDTVRYLVVEGLRKDMPNRATVTAAPVVYGCRMIKTAHEIEIMQAANDITVAAYREIYPKVEAGMTGPDISKLMNDATRKLGGSPQFSLALIGEASAYPHGSEKVHKVAEGEIILMDCGCSYLGYESDISRTWVHGEASAEQARVWNTVRRGQELALETAKVGVPARAVDAAVRKMYEKEGFGPGYQLPGLSHRLGHGIGMEGHEPINFVGNEDTKLAAGMCFSNEPGIYLPGKFGVRHEDCLYMTEDGPVLFSGLSPSIDNPMG